MRGKKSIWCVAAVSMLLGALGVSSGQAAPIPDPATATPCNASGQCPTGHYCHPFAHVCYNGVAVVCNIDADCKTPGAYCHVNRCHVGATPCTTNQNCRSTEYCHYGVCHAEECQTDADCPVGVLCIISRKVCALP
jgi:hypothetical protein